MATATRKNPKDHFRFWFPIDKLEKSVDKKGNAVMKIGGIASTGRKDTDDEIMDTNGFQLDYFEERGIINWNHSQKPDHVIGEPTKVENRDAGLYVESMLYPTNKLAKSAYELAETLNKHSKRRRLGYSIEGKVLSRDPNDPRKVKKALITNLALTISPKNADSLVDIIKGNYHEIEDYEYEIEKSVNFSEANGGNQQLIIDILRPDGMRVTVDSDLNISVKKALDTDGGRAITRESLEGKKKNLNKSERYLTWDECIEKIKSTNSVIDVEKANIFIDKLNNLAMATKNSKTSITDDLLSKALKNVGILTPSKVKKSNAGDDDEEEDEDDDEETQAGGDEQQASAKRLSKGNDDGDDDDDDEEEEMPAKKKKTTVKKANKGQRISSVTVVDDTNNELIKSVGIITKAVLDEVKGLRKENELLKSQFDEMSEQLEDVLNTPANGRKSLSKPVNKNFKKSLGADDEDENEDVRVLSLSRDKNQILDMLDDQAFNKGNVDDFARNQMSSFEMSNKINKSMVDKLEREYSIKIVA